MKGMDNSASLADAEAPKRSVYTAPSSSETTKSERNGKMIASDQ